MLGKKDMSSTVENSAIAGKGLINQSNTLSLKYVLHVPKLACNLLSVSKLSKDSNCRVIFFESHCVSGAELGEDDW